MIDDSVFLKPFFSQLNKLNVQYGVMRNYKTLPSSLGGSDLDILISVKDISIFYSVFNKLLEEVNGNVSVFGSGFVLESKKKITKVLFIKFGKNVVHINLNFFRAELVTSEYAKNRDFVKAKLGNSEQYIASLDI